MVPDFFPVADVASLPPGRCRTVHVQGREFALFNLDGQFFAIDDQCPHRGGPLGAGCFENGHVFCPLHGWEFDVQTGTCLTRADKPVRSYPTRVVEGQVEIEI